jgi:hypothetical protein
MVYMWGRSTRNPVLRGELQDLKAVIPWLMGEEGEYDV